MPIKRLLIISEAFANPYIVGSTRITNFAHYLPRNIWEVHVITANDISNKQTKSYLNDESEKYADFLIKIDYDSSISSIPGDNILKKFKRFFKVEESRSAGLYHQMLQTAHEYIKSHQIDIILATTSDLFTLAIAKKVSSIHHIPWVADLRDIWEQHIEKYDKLLSRGRIYIERSIKRRNYILKSASLIITANNQTDLIRKKVGKKPSIIQINNGYDPKVFHILNQKDLIENKIFKIVYTGRIGSSQLNNLPILFKVLIEIINESVLSYQSLHIEFYHTEKQSVIPFIPEELKDNIHFQPFMKGEEISKKIYPETGIFLLSAHSGNVNQVPTKFYEYCTARKPIICICRNKEIQQYFEFLNNGRICENETEIKDYLIQIINEFKLKGYTYIDIPETKIEEFSREKQTQKLSHELENILYG